MSRSAATIGQARQRLWDGTYNRAGDTSAADALRRRARPHRRALAVLYLGLDGFKPINDCCAHAVGDRLLHAVAAPVEVGALEPTVHPNIGIATCPADGISAVALPGNADAAMYLARRQRSSYAIYEPCGPIGLGVRPTCTTGATIAAPAKSP